LEDKNLNNTFYLIKDPGSSTKKYLLWHNGQVTHHFVPSSCELISEEIYKDEFAIARPWGTGVVCLSTEDGKKYYRVGVNPIQQTTDALEKWQSTVISTICTLGWIGQSSSEELTGSLKILLPLDEEVYKLPMMRAIAFALKNTPFVNGQAVNNIKITNPTVVMEGSGFCMGVQPSAGLICGHCDLSFAIGYKGMLSLDKSFTLSGAGAILPLRLSGLRLGDELSGAIAFSNGQWAKFARNGLTKEDVKASADVGIEAYVNRYESQFQQIARVLENNGLPWLTIGGGSARFIGRLVRPLFKVNPTDEIEQRIEKIFGCDRSSAARLVDLFLISQRIEEFRDFYENGAIVPTTKLNTQITIDVNHA
jgi:hypothetical protein